MAGDQEVTGDKFPCKLVLDIPFPSARLAKTALRALSVDKELSVLVHRTFELGSNTSEANGATNGVTNGTGEEEEERKTVLKVVYQAATNRMLRVSVNGFFESLRLVVQVMEDLDVDVAMGEGGEMLSGVQGLGEAAVGV